MPNRTAIAVLAATLAVSTGAAAHPPAPRARTTVKAATPMIHAPASARVGATVHVTTSGLVRGRYALSLVADRRPARGARCLARLARATGRSTRPSFTARIPARLRCYQGLDTPLGRVPTGAGTYHLAVGVPIAPAGNDGRYSLVQAAVRITP